MQKKLMILQNIIYFIEEMSLIHNTIILSKFKSKIKLKDCLLISNLNNLVLVSLTNSKHSATILNLWETQREDNSAIFSKILI